MTTKKEKPIIFSTPMVRAILGGHKTMTRRVVKLQPCIDSNGFINIKSFWLNPEKDRDHTFDGIAPYCVGDILWVREMFCEYRPEHIIDGKRYAYKANITAESDRVRREYCYKWKPSIHMPRKAARIFLKVKDVRVERVRAITAEDKAREGFCDCCRSYPCVEKDKCGKPCFMKLWDTLNAKRGYGWDSNPWVWVIEFKRTSDINAGDKNVWNKTE